MQEELVMNITWRSNLATGHHDIDQHHKEMFQRIDSLVDACRQGGEKAAVQDMLKFLQSYVQNHFAAEERLLKKGTVANASEHFRQHEELRGQLDRLVADFAQEGAALGVVTNSLKLTYVWLKEHIQQMDMTLVAACAGQSH